MKLKILYSHLGREGKDGWGRSFYMAKALANLGHDVTFLTTKDKFSLVRVEKKVYKKVKVLSFPEILPGKIKSKGFGTNSLFLKSYFAATNKFDLVIADCGHRHPGLPCKMNRIFHKSIYITEWWDNFGKNGYYKNKPFLFKLLYGTIETKSEMWDKKGADGVVVLSTFMRDRAFQEGIKEVKIIQGGALVQDLKFSPFTKGENKKLTFGYLGMGRGEEKHLDPFLRAVSKFKNKLEFWSYGGYLKEDVIKEYDLEGVIKEKGWIDYLKSSEDLRHIDIFVLMRIDDNISRAGWPNKLGDYLALGRPVLIFPYGDLSEFIKRNNGEGFITTTFDQSSVKKRIEEILRDFYNLEEMGYANRKLAREISWERKAQEFIDFYYSLQDIK